VVAGGIVVSIAYTSAATLAGRIRDGELSPVEVLDALFARIDAHDDVVNAFVHTCEDDAYEAARAAERAVETGDDLGPLHGVPVAIKDLDTPVEGAPMTCGSVPLADNVAQADCLLVERLKAAGAIVVGMTNVPEFGHKGTTDNPLHGTTVTPFDTDRIAGGSSGGSAAALAAGMAPLAVGSDAGGSIRIPASACGVVGLMPSFGLVPFDARPDALEPHTPFTALGPLARSVEDVALALEVVAGWHRDDPFAVPAPDADYLDADRRDDADLSVQYSPDLGVFPIEEAVTNVTDEAIAALEAAGASVTFADPDFGHDRETMLDAWENGFRLLMSSLLDKVERALGVDLLGDHREELSPQFVEYIEAGLAQSSTAFKRADMIRTDVYDAVNEVLADHDVLATPTLAVPPFDADVAGPTEVDGRAVDPYFGWPMTWVFNLTGHPVLSVPAGFTGDGLPVGLQLVGQRFDDETVLAAGAALERVRPWANAYPPAGIGGGTGNREDPAQRDAER
jgi:aspartyl-tRNA(Asn)/glutamyl-tRNA(Gln) amidotransferase subunit A